MSSTLSRVLAWALSLVIGAVYGTAATVAHAYTAGGLPIGLVLAVVGTGALLIALRALTSDRWTALAGGLGVLVATFVFSNVGPGGSAIVAPATEATAWIPLVWTGAVPVLVALVVAWPDLSRARTTRTPAPADARRMDA